MEDIKSPSRRSLFRACKSPFKASTLVNYGNNNGESVSASVRKNEKDMTYKALAIDLLERFPMINDNFDIVKKVGEGTFSKVYMAKYKKDPEQMVALKHLIPTSSPGRIENELNCLMNVGGSNNVIGINCTLRRHDHVVFMLPYYPHQKFSEFFRTMKEENIRKYMKNLFIALKHVHSKKIIHRDVKPSNFIYCSDMDAYSLIDFGLAMPVPGSDKNLLKDYTTKGKYHHLNTYSNCNSKSICKHNPKALCTLCKARSRQSTPRAGTPGFRSPEVLLKFPSQTTAVDMWSAGVILLCILSKRYPFFKAKEDLHALAQIMAIFGSRKIQKMAEEIGKDFIVSPPIEQPFSLKEQCIKLSKRVCPVHDEELFQLVHKGKRKRSRESYEEIDFSLELKRPMRNTRSRTEDNIAKKGVNINNNNNESLNKAKPDKLPNLKSCSEKEKNSKKKPKEAEHICSCLPDSLYDLLEKLLTLNPLKRITAEEALSHPFIKSK